jgi:hypothetical protein
MNRIDIYRQAIKRTFADLYGVSPDTVDVSWTTGKIIVVQCAGKTFLLPILSEPDEMHRSSLAPRKTRSSSL